MEEFVVESIIPIMTTAFDGLIDHLSSKLQVNKEAIIEGFRSYNLGVQNDVTTQLQGELSLEKAEKNKKTVWIGKYTNQSFIVGGKHIDHFRILLKDLGGEWKASLKGVTRVIIFTNPEKLNLVKNELKNAGAIVTIDNSYFDSLTGELQNKFKSSYISPQDKDISPKLLEKDDPPLCPIKELPNSSPSIPSQIKRIKVKNIGNDQCYSEALQLLFQKIIKLVGEKERKTLICVGYKKTISSDVYTLLESDIKKLEGYSYRCDPMYVGSWRLKRLKNEIFYSEKYKFLFEKKGDENILWCIGYRESENSEDDLELTEEDTKTLEIAGYRWDPSKVTLDENDKIEGLEDEEDDHYNLDEEDESEGESDGEETE